MKIIFKTKDGKEFDNEFEAEYHENDLEKNKTINLTQSLILDVIKQGSFNGFNAEETVAFLIKNKKYWVGVMPEFQYYALRDIDDNCLNFDTVLIKCKDEESAKTFYKIIKKEISPESVSIEIDEGDYGTKKQKRIIRLWWD